MRRIVIAAMLAASSFGPSQAQPQPSQGRFDIQKYGVIIADSKWRRKVIEVCWEDMAAADESARSIVRLAVANTWEKVADITFTGWAKCPIWPAPGVRIAVRDEGPHTVDVGRYLDGHPSGMVLNFSFGNWGQSCAGTRHDSCVYVVAAHEFGHALGFTHEQNRRDAPPWCLKEAKGPDGDFFATEYDPVSIMNYCNPSWNGDGKLSERDIAAVQLIYGPKRIIERG